MYGGEDPEVLGKYGAACAALGLQCQTEAVRCSFRVQGLELGFRIKGLESVQVALRLTPG